MPTCPPVRTRSFLDLGSPSLRLAVAGLALVVLTASASPASAAEGADERWLARARRSIEGDLYRAVETGGGQEESYRAANPAQGFQARFEARGLHLEGPPDKASGRAAWEWGLELRGWGRPGGLQPAGEGFLVADASRVELQRELRLTEWFENGPEGLEHGFTVAEPPDEEGEGEGVLVLDLALSGDLRPVFADDGQAVDFYAGGGISVLRYAKLMVTDTNGEVIAAWMEPVKGGLRIAMADGGAAYPLTVDPLATSASWTGSGDEDIAGFGVSVATAGDVNGDGYGDVVVGAYLHDAGFPLSNRGRAYLYMGSASGLALAPAWVGSGDESGAHYGYSVATAGDVNADGYSDVVVGASLHDAGAGAFADRGRTYLYLGSASGLSIAPAWIASGDEDGSKFGESVAAAGDVNGDGYGDVVVGAYLHDAGAGAAADRGRAYLYLGSAAGLSIAPAWIGSGTENEAYFGVSVATAGDVNGDGFGDVVVGAYRHDAGAGAGADRGRAYLYLGSASGLEPASAWIASGDENGAWFGVSVATAGDVNGDGYADVLVGAQTHSAGAGVGADRGRVYLYLGLVSGLATAPVWTASGDVNSAQLGCSVATAGDVNGDGYSDIVVGAYKHDGGGGVSALRGRAYVYLGSASGPPAGAIWIGSGDEDDASYGFSVATAGDVNGDGFSDVVVGARDHDAGGGALASRGRAYAYLGSASGIELGYSPANLLGDENGANLGFSLAAAGDVNGDGYSDVIVGAPQHDAGAGIGANRGRAYLYLGSTPDLAINPAWTGSGDENNASFGFSVAGAGDVNGDGYADVIVGAYTHTAGAGAGAGRGRTYVYLGSPSGLSGSPSWTASGDENAGYFGISVAGAGDVNGDGYADVIVGAYTHDAGAGAGADRGRAYVYLGSPSGLATVPDWTADGDEDLALFGRAVAGAGDINGDGYGDVIVGAHQHDAGGGAGANRGRAYVYLGSSSGLAASPAWIGSGDENFAAYGRAVAAAGDVNGDGYADVAVGAYLHDGGGGVNANRGRTYVYLGSSAGLATNPGWTGSGDENGGAYGISVGSAADVNDDGFSDLVVGAYLHDAGAGGGADRGRAYGYLGSASGLGTSPNWVTSGDENLSYSGFAVAGMRDVNGDGYADVMVGEFLHDVGAGAGADRGLVRVYHGRANVAPFLPRQMRADRSAPISPGGLAHDQEFKIQLTLQPPPMGVSPVRRLQWQVRPWGGRFLAPVAPLQSDAFWYDLPEDVDVLLNLGLNNRRYIWRARVQYHPAQSPFIGWSRWFTISDNGPYEADVYSTSQSPPPPCVAPDEEIYIYAVTIDLNGKPVLHSMDANQPPDVTGYNVYRSSSPSGPWTLIGSNVVDMDQGTPNIQYVDLTGDVGGSWNYKVAAFNGNCGAEGPW